MGEPIYYKLRQKFSSEIGEWTFHETFGPWTQETMEEIAEQSHHEYDWSEHYRGCDIEKVDYPPLDWINEEILRAQHRMRNAQIRFERLRALRQTVENLPSPEEK